MFFKSNLFINVYRMLDEFGNELEMTDSRLDSTMKRVAKVLHLNNGKSYIFYFTIYLCCHEIK